MSWDTTHRPGALKLTSRYSGQGLAVDCIIIATVDVDPLLGAFGFTGADATIGLGSGHCGVKGCVVRV
jgi:hypothetical protein